MCINTWNWFDNFKKLQGYSSVVEHRSPKPSVVGSNPAAPAIYIKSYSLIFLFNGVSK